MGGEFWRCERWRERGDVRSVGPVKVDAGIVSFLVEATAGL